MNFVSSLFFLWMVLFILITWLPVERYFAHVLSFFGLTVILFSGSFAGSILIIETLICFFACRSGAKHKLVSTTLSATIVLITFLLFKYLSKQSSLVLPLGISYFSFRLLHYVQESYRGRIRNHSLIEFIAYMTFFPTYLVGPINLFPEFLQDLRRRSRDAVKFSYGLERMIWGYAKLVIVGNYLINFLLKRWIISQNITGTGFLGLTVHSVQLWLDLYVRFSAYSSIAIGLAAIAGFRVPENFNFPFLATNIRDFWQRWHMSLTGWCREYIFVPIAAVTRKPYLAIGATMVAIGIWHEISLRYILWGLYHSVGIMTYEKYLKFVNRRIPETMTIAITRKVIGITFTMIFVIASFPVTSIINNYLIALLT